MFLGVDQQFVGGVVVFQFFIDQWFVVLEDIVQVVDYEGGCGDFVDLFQW